MLLVLASATVSLILDPAEPGFQDITLTKMIEFAKGLLMEAAKATKTISKPRGSVMKSVEIVLVSRTRDPARPVLQDITLTKMIKLAKSFVMVAVTETKTIFSLKGTV